MYDLSDIDPLQAMVSVFANNLLTAIMLVGVLWGIHLLNVSSQYRLCRLGIIPRHPFGLIGIFFSPWLHGNFNHLFFNSIPLCVLATFVLTGGMTHFAYVTAFITLVSGFLLWLVGRPGVHIGASGLIMGYWAYVLVSAVNHASLMTVLLALLSLYYFGGLFLSLLPGEVGVSWEGHVCGFVAGVLALFVFGDVTIAAV